LPSKELLHQVENIVGKQSVMTKIEDRLTYAYDASFHRHIPDLVVFPTNEDQVVRLLTLANEEELPIVPRGAGTGLTAGSVPVKGGIVLSLTRMNRIKVINPENLTAIVQPGVVTGFFQREVEKQKLYYPPDPQSFNTSTLGGNIAENAGGPRCFKYGVTRDYVLGLRVISPSGKTWNFGGQTMKNVTGYNMSSLIVGSEGTLGIITQATLRLIPQPEARKTIMAVFNLIEQAAETVSGIIANRIVPAALEFLDDVSLRCIEQTLSIGLPLDAAAILLIEVDGFRETIEREIQLIKEVCIKCGAKGITIAQNDEESQKLWAARRAFAPALLKLNPTRISEDATVPRDKLIDFIKGVKEIAIKYNLKLALAGHAGDGNMHPNFLVNTRDRDEMERVEKAVGELFALTISLGGTLSGEHGIGTTKAPYLSQELNKDTIGVMQAIKHAMDPKGILNPGKIFFGDSVALPFSQE